MTITSDQWDVELHSFFIRTRKFQSRLGVLNISPMFLILFLNCS